MIFIVRTEQSRNGINLVKRWRSWPKHRPEYDIECEVFWVDISLNGFRHRYDHLDLADAYPF
jgi:hypothetical protein